VTRRRNPARLVIALSVAAALAVFLVYTSLAGGATPSLKPSQLASHKGEVSLAGMVVGTVDGDAHGAGMRFALRDIDGTATVRVLYRGSVPDLFNVGTHVYMRGELREDTFVASPGSLVTKCPSKYAPEDST
jgi:cytochrome c-type biogenesis protein CcmE